MNKRPTGSTGVKEPKLPLIPCTRAYRQVASHGAASLLELLNAKRSGAWGEGRGGGWQREIKT